VPEGCEQGGHEATLLKLSCDKALFHLHWRAALEFPQTVAMTVDWYRAWHQGAHDIYRTTVGQIEQYCHEAQKKGSPWIQP
jgi:CDP-glucose 4,6-dehydratase